MGEEDPVEDSEIFAIQQNETPTNRGRVRIELTEPPTCISAVQIKTLPTIEDIKQKLPDCIDFAPIFN